MRSLLLNWKGSDWSSYDLTHHKDDFLNKNKILFQTFFRINSFWRIWRGFKYLRKRSWKFLRDLTAAWSFVPDVPHRAPWAHVVSGAWELNNKLLQGKEKRVNEENLQESLIVQNCLIHWFVKEGRFFVGQEILFHETIKDRELSAVFQFHHQ